MAKIPYSKLGLKQDTSVKTITFNEKEVEVLKYLPINEKWDIIESALLKSRSEDGIYNELLLQMYFELNLIYSYTNISFTEKQRDDEFKLYDILTSSGFMDKFFDTIDQDEYSDLISMLELTKQNNLDYNFTVAYILNRFINDLPRNAEIMAQVVDNFNPEQYQQLQNFAKIVGFRGESA